MVNEARLSLEQTLQEKKSREYLTFDNFLERANAQPWRSFRSIFQLIYDMIHHFVPQGIDEYPNDPESINFVNYDCKDLFVTGVNKPYFADRIFSNRFIRLVDSSKQGAGQNRLYLFEGPPGSGKSTFLDAFLHSFNIYTRLDEGATYETVWRLDPEKFKKVRVGENTNLIRNGQKIDVPCPSHDHPILQIPKEYREEFLQKLIKNNKFKRDLFTSKEYEWILKEEPCTICSSIYQSLADRLDDSKDIFNMLYARRMWFDRRKGEGISVYSPGDKPLKNAIGNRQIQEDINELLRDSNAVKYVHSELAKTNHGIYVIMDVKGHNVERIKKLHGVISDGVHKVNSDSGSIEENINTCFIGLINPEDKKHIESDSFKDRIIKVEIPYEREYNAEVNIYHDQFGVDLENYFLPGVLENFAKLVVSSRLDQESNLVLSWIDDHEEYYNFCDKNMLLLRMELYTGKIPPWLSVKDRNNFTAEIRKAIIGEANNEGFSGISGRRSIEILGDFLSKYKDAKKLINMNMVHNFFSKNDELRRELPNKFNKELLSSYDYNILEQMKEALYEENEERVSNDIKNYLHAINFYPKKTIRREEVCPHTQEIIEITGDFFDRFELLLYGKKIDKKERMKMRTVTQKEYVSKTIPEIHFDGKNITETEQYKDLYQQYLHNIQENVFDPFLGNDNFRNAIREYDTEKFASYDKRIQEDVTRLINRLQEKFHYNEEGARQVSIYVLDHIISEE
jgi:predicted Ser/Thr protein kinase